MKGFKECEKGHFYKDDLDACPYCPKQRTNNPTQVGNYNDKTHMFGPGAPTIANSDTKTVVFGQGGSSPVNSPSAEDNSSVVQHDLTKTFIQGIGNGRRETLEQVRTTRKIAGWIISYTLDPMGIDFKIYEGKNIIGRDTTSDIVIDKNTVSGKHAHILCKNNKFYLRDEMSANGIMVNGAELDLNAVHELEDGDVITLGKDRLITFRFKSAL